MDQGTVPTRNVRLEVRGGRVGLIWRLTIALGASAAAGIGVDHLLVGTIQEPGVRALVAAGAAATLIGVALWILVVVPLARSREELHLRYEAALADSLSDPLTGLGNHRAFQEELTRQVEAAQRYSTPLALAIIDLDGFKLLNDRSGHAYGDQALTHFGDTVSTSIRRVDRPFRVGGDEFAILLPHTDADGARTVVRRVLAATLQPARQRDGEETPEISFSAGISALPEPATTRAQLYSQADAALYQAKHAGRTEVVIFDPAVEAVEVSSDAALAIAEVVARGQLRPVYQPIVDLASGRVLGVEGLIRPVAPAPFPDPGALFSAAASSGHTVSLDLTCFETIVRGARLLEPDQFLSVNLSPITVEAPEFGAPVLQSILARLHFPPSRIVLELTEREEIRDVDKVRGRLEACRSAGMRLAADDVGAGNAGLRLLSEMQFDIIKVDLELVRRSSASATSSAVIESVVALAAHTNAMVIGEGVEEDAQVSQLAALGVTAGQGYLLGRPGPLSSGAGEQSRALVPLQGVVRVGAAAGATAARGEDAGNIAEWRRSLGLPVS
jgi:diguanylate cyclase (GGDEF)-like protein